MLRMNHGHGGTRAQVHIGHPRARFAKFKLEVRAPAAEFINLAGHYFILTQLIADHVETVRITCCFSRSFRCN